MKESTSSASSGRSADGALRDHFARELAGVEGRSRAAFLAAVEQEAGVAGNRHSPARRLFLGTLLAAAAALAFGFGIWSARTVSPDVSLATGDPLAEKAPDDGSNADSAREEPERPFQTLAYDPGDLRPVTPVAREQWWQTRDAGTYVVDGEPVRAVQRREWEKTSFRNAAGFVVTIERPREQWMLVDADVQ